MPFATRSDLLARCNARRLAQLAVPADVDMVPDDALRLAVNGGDVSGYTQAVRDALDLALEAIDNALTDADALILSYGIPETVQTTLLARMASTIALWYLQGAERMTEEANKAYDNAVAMLKSHARGEINLAPADPADVSVTDDLAYIASNPARYTSAATTGDNW